LKFARQPLSACSRNLLASRAKFLEIHCKGFENRLLAIGIIFLTNVSFNAIFNDE